MTDEIQDQKQAQITLIDGLVTVEDLSPKGKVQVGEEITPQAVVVNEDDSPLDAVFGWEFTDNEDIALLQETVEATLPVGEPKHLVFDPVDTNDFESGTYSHEIVAQLADPGDDGPVAGEFQAFLEPDSVGSDAATTLYIEVPVEPDDTAVDIVWKTEPKFEDVELESTTIGGDATFPMLRAVSPDGVIVVSQEDIGSGLYVAEFTVEVGDMDEDISFTEAKAVVRNDDGDTEYDFEDLVLDAE